eukprot:PhM_4_TR2125/c1_g4_i1/m.19189
MFFSDLPHDTIVIMLEFISDYRTLGRIACVNSLLSGLALDDDLWKAQARLFLPSQRFQTQLSLVTDSADASWKGWRRYFMLIRMQGKVQQIASFIIEASAKGMPSARFLQETRDAMSKMLDLRLSTGGCIGPGGTRALSQVLAENRCLQTLDLHGQLMRPEGVEALSAVLPDCVSLVSLVLSQNKLGPKGCDALATVLPRMKIVSLDLRSNFLGPAGGASLATALGTKTTTVERLFVDDNNFGDAASAQLLSLLGSRLRMLFIRENGLSKHSAEALRRVIDAHSGKTVSIVDASLMSASGGSRRETATNFSKKVVAELRASARSKGINVRIPDAQEKSGCCCS